MEAQQTDESQKKAPPADQGNGEADESKKPPVDEPAEESDPEDTADEEGASEEDAAEDEGEEKQQAKKTGEDESSDEESDEADGGEELSLKVSDGSLLTDADVEAVKAEAKEDGLTPAQAQKRLERAEKAKAEFVEANKPYGKEWQTRVDAWEKETKADPEIGGNKKKLAESLFYAKKFAEKNLSKETRKFLEESGLGSHKYILRDLARLGRKRYGSDKSVHGKGAPVKQKSDSDLIYGEGTETKVQGQVKDEE